MLTPFITLAAMLLTSLETYSVANKPCKGLSIKNVRSQGKGGLSSADKRGSSLMRTPKFFGAKIVGFFEIHGVSARTRGVEPVRIFFGQGGSGQFFANLYGQLLWTLKCALKLV